MINCSRLQQLHRVPAHRQRAPQSLCVRITNAVRPGLEKSELPVQGSSPQSMETNPEPHNSCQAGPQRDLSAYCHPVHRQGGCRLSETGGKPAEIRQDPI